MGKLIKPTSDEEWNPGDYFYYLNKNGTKVKAVITAESGSDQDLRKWCLERAIEKRDLTGVKHMAVTNVAAEYFRWIKDGLTDSFDCSDMPDDKEDAVSRNPAGGLLYKSDYRKE